MATVTYDSFIGGQQASTKRGYKYGFQDGIGIDYRSDPDKITALRRLEKESGSVVTGLIKWLKEYDGYIFGFDDAGKLYRRSTDATPVWSAQRTVSNSLGQGLEVFNTIDTDALWYANTATLGRATTLTGTMAFDDDYISTIHENRDQQNIPSSFAGTPYSLATSIAETATHKQTFTPAKYMLKGFQIYVTAKGTSADWTLTLHDSVDMGSHMAKVIGTVTVSNANLTNSEYNNFYFSDVLTLTPGHEYHYHLTVSNTTGTPTAGTGTNNDLEDGAYYSIMPSLVADNYFHPMKEFTNLLCIGNGRFLATLDDSEIYDPERLVFPKGEIVRCLEVVGDYIAIITWRYNDITKVNTSRMYLWDGVSPTFRNIIQITGQVNAIVNHDNILYFVNGTNGQISAWSGAITPIRKLNFVGNNKTVEVYPGAICTWDNLIHFGISNGTSSSCPRVIYTYGTQNKDYPASLNASYPVSADELIDIAEKQNNSNIQIGACIGTDSGTFIVSWKDDSTYGVDKLVTTKEQNSVYLTTLRFDGGKSHVKKNLKKILLFHSPLTNDDNITVEYRINNSGFFQELFTDDADESENRITYTFVENDVLDFLEIEFRIWINGADSLPDLYSLTMEYEETQSIQTDSLKVDAL